MIGEVAFLDMFYCIYKVTDYSDHLRDFTNNDGYPKWPSQKTP